MKYISLIRHGETRFLRDHPNSSAPNDEGLSDAGRSQVSNLAECLVLIQPEVIFSSQLVRARETADILSELCKVKCFYTSALNEFHVAPDGTKLERTEEGVSRSMCFLSGLWPLYERVAVVSHRSILGIILQFILNEPYSNCKQHFGEPGSMVCVRYDWNQGDSVWKIIQPGTTNGAEQSARKL
jgi:broad specificity phosphatase PhoE